MTRPTYRKALRIHILNNTPMEEREPRPTIWFYAALFLAAIAITLALHDWIR